VAGAPAAVRPPHVRLDARSPHLRERCSGGVVLHRPRLVEREDSLLNLLRVRLSTYASAQTASATCSSVSSGRAAIRSPYDAPCRMGLLVWLDCGYPRSLWLTPALSATMNETRGAR
jgi:hypothetical protein